MKQQHIITIIIGILTFGAGFFGGKLYQQKTQPTLQRRQFQQGPNGQMNRNTNGNNQINRPITGEIISIDDTSITIKLPDGGSKIVFFSENTTIAKAQKVLSTELKKDEHITVFGTTNNEGTITASQITVGVLDMMRQNRPQ